MNNSKNNIAANLRHLRSLRRLSQEEIAEKIGVTRQAVAKWENGDSLPDILNCEALADLFDVSLNDLVRYDPEQEGVPMGPKNKHIFGAVTIGERGQIVFVQEYIEQLFGYDDPTGMQHQKMTGLIQHERKKELAETEL